MTSHVAFILLCAAVIVDSVPAVPAQKPATFVLGLLALFVYLAAVIR